MVIVTSIMRVRKEDEQIFREKLQTFMEKIKHHRGLILHTLQQDRNDPCRFMFIEEFLNQECYDEHGRQPEMKEWAPIRDSYVIERHLFYWNSLHCTGSFAPYYQADV